MDPLVHTRVQGTVETVDFTRRTCSEEGEDCPIGRKGDGHRFLGFTRCIPHGFAAELQKIRPHLAKAPAHTTALAKAKLVELGYELLPHPPYSPDLAPCDFFLFPNLKKSLAGQKFE